MIYYLKVIVIGKETETPLTHHFENWNVALNSLEVRSVSKAI